MYVWAKQSNRHRLIGTQQRCAGKTNQRCSGHNFFHRLVHYTSLGAVTFIDKNKNIALSREIWWKRLLQLLNKRSSIT